MVKILTVLVSTIISNSQVFLLKNVSSYSHFFSKNISIYAIFNDQSFNDTLTNDIVSFEQLGPGGSLNTGKKQKSPIILRRRWGFVVFHLFQYYLSHFKMMKGWWWNGLCDEALYSHKLNSASRQIQTGNMVNRSQEHCLATWMCLLRRCSITVLSTSFRKSFFARRFKQKK